MASMRNVTSMADFDEVVANAGGECIIVEFWSDNMPVMEVMEHECTSMFTRILRECSTVARVRTPTARL